MSSGLGVLHQVSDRTGCVVQLRRHSGHEHGPELRVLKLDPHLVVGDDLPAEPGVSFTDGRPWYVRVREDLHPFSARLFGEPRVEGGDDLVPAGRHHHVHVLALDALRRVELNQAHGLQDTDEELLRQRSEEEPFSVAALVQTVVGRPATRVGAGQPHHPFRFDCSSTLRRRQCVQTCDGEGLALAALPTLVERRGDGRRCDVRVVVALHRRDEVHRPLLVAELHVRDARDGRHQGVVRRKLAPAAVRRVHRQPHVQQPRVRRLQRRLVQPEPLKLARREVEHRGVCGLQQFPRLAESLVGLQVQHDATFVPVPAQVPRRVSHPVAGGRLNLNHIGAEVGQQHGPHRPRNALAKVENAVSLKGGHAPEL